VLQQSARESAAESGAFAALSRHQGDFTFLRSRWPELPESVMVQILGN
jgi:hypothetical protein